MCSTILTTSTASYFINVPTPLQLRSSRGYSGTIRYYLVKQSHTIDKSTTPNTVSFMKHDQGLQGN